MIARRARRAVVASLLVVAAALASAAAPAGAAPADAVVLLTKQQGGGREPTFRWKPVPGAAEYLLVVQNKKGRAYWSWQGTDTQVVIGGGDGSMKSGPGSPHVSKGYRWIVSAFGPDGELLAISKRRPIAP